MKSSSAHTKPSSQKSLFALAIAFSLLALGVELARANDLANGNLDVVAIGPQKYGTPIGWDVQATKVISGGFMDGCSSETWCNVQDLGGYGLFFKPFQGTIGDEISVQFTQDLPASPGGKYTFSGYAAGEANFCAFFNTNTPQPQALFVVEFLNSLNDVVASNALDLVAAGLPSSGPGSMTQFIMPEVTAPANTAIVRVGALMNNAYGTGGAQSFFVDAFDLTSVAPPGAPVITNQPAQTTVSLGGTAMFTVGVSNLAGVTYQWQFNGANISDGGNLSGTTTASLTIANVSTNDVGRYRVRVSNSVGSTVSAEATLAIMEINLFPVISVSGRIGDFYRLDYSEKAAPTTWIPLSTNRITTIPQMIIDSTSPLAVTRFYRAVLVQ